MEAGKSLGSGIVEFPLSAMVQNSAELVRMVIFLKMPCVTL